MTDLEIRNELLAAGVRLNDLPAVITVINALTNDDTAAAALCDAADELEAQANNHPGNDLPVDRIGAGGITAGQLQADAASARQDAVDAKLAETVRSQTVYGAEELLIALHGKGNPAR